MPKIVILGSCLHEPYKILAMPKKLDAALYESDHEKAYEMACKVFFPAIDESDVVLVYAPEGPHNLGEHTLKDTKYALDQGKEVVYFGYSNKYFGG